MRPRVQLVARVRPPSVSRLQPPPGNVRLLPAWARLRPPAVASNNNHDKRERRLGKYTRRGGGVLWREGGVSVFEMPPSWDRRHRRLNAPMSIGCRHVCPKRNMCEFNAKIVRTVAPMFRKTVDTPRHHAARRDLHAGAENVQQGRRRLQATQESTRFMKAEQRPQNLNRGMEVDPPCATATRVRYATCAAAHSQPVWWGRLCGHARHAAPGSAGNEITTQFNPDENGG